MKRLFALLLFAILMVSCTSNMPKESKNGEYVLGTVEKYMPNDVGGFVVLETKRCPIKEVEHEYPQSAYMTNFEGKRHNGCWVHPKPPTQEAPPGYVLRERHVVYFVVDGIKYISSFDKRLFSTEKKRWDKYPLDHPELEPKATL